MGIRACAGVAPEGLESKNKTESESEVVFMVGPDILD
jgi:hypothetical protein